MGCGTLSWSNVFDHALGIAEGKEDAATRSHIAECDVCLGDLGELNILGGRIKSLAKATELTGNEAFADKLRSDVRNTLGGGRMQRQTSSWRATHSGETQRIRREQMRRRSNTMRYIRTALLITALIAGGISSVVLFFGEQIIDNYGASIEAALGIDFASLDMRPTTAQLRTRAEEIELLPELKQLGHDINRVITRELALGGLTRERLLALEFAQMIALEGQSADVALVGAVLEYADRNAELDNVPLIEGERSALLLKARGERERRNNDVARECLRYSLHLGLDVETFYYGAIETRAEGLATGAEYYLIAAKNLKIANAEYAWQLMKSGNMEAALLAARDVDSDAISDELKKSLSRNANTFGGGK